MKRLKSIDNFRGFSIIIMVWAHLCGWWLSRGHSWFTYPIYLYVDRIFGPGFLFIAGISAAIFYSKGKRNLEISEDYNYHKMRYEYFFRAIFILIIALIFNSFVAIGTKNPLDIWKWFVILTIAISLIIAWPLFKTPRWCKILLATIIWIINYYILYFLLPYKDQINIYGGIFHILYNSLDLEPILSFFSFFLIGAVIGEMIFDIYQIENQNERRIIIRNKIIFPLLIFAIILIILGIIYGYPPLYKTASFSWITFSLGINILLLTIFIIFEEFEIFKIKKSYKFLYYYSYYSLTVYLTHFLFYFLFYRQLNLISLALSITSIIILLTLLLRTINNSKWREKVSLKLQIGKLAKGLAMRIEEKKIKI